MAKKIIKITLYDATENVAKVITAAKVLMMQKDPLRRNVSAAEATEFLFFTLDRSELLELLENHK